MYKRIGKRFFDVLLTIPVLGITAPFMGMISFFAWIKLGRPIFFRQERPGLNGKNFVLLKFRTMTNEHDSQGNLLPDGERLTSFGRFLRVTSLDELPELINVLRGEMSLVGPRPLLQRYTPFFFPEERLRFSIRPGITGLSQIRGRNDLSWDLRLAGDVDYVRRCSLSLDIQIILITLGRVITQRGLHVDPCTYMLDLDEERKGMSNCGTEQKS